jgi:SAM-dependent methyltransferase
VQALDCYRWAPVGDRIHTWVRWRSCPFEAVAAEVPTEGDILELGCGHGLFSLHLAITAPDRRVTGSDIDAEKLVVARRAAAVSGREISFFDSPAGAPPPGPWDAVAIVDVLYLLDPDAQRRVLVDAALVLAPGGLLVVKEMGEAPAWKARWNRIQEALAVKVLRITEGATIALVPPSTYEGWLADAGLTVTSSRRIDRRYPHPHHLLVARKPA